MFSFGFCYVCVWNNPIIPQIEYAKMFSLFCMYVYADIHILYCMLTEAVNFDGFSLNLKEQSGKNSALYGWTFLYFCTHNRQSWAKWRHKNATFPRATVWRISFLRIKLELSYCTLNYSMFLSLNNRNLVLPRVQNYLFVFFKIKRTFYFIFYHFKF